MNIYIRWPACYQCDPELFIVYIFIHRRVCNRLIRAILHLWVSSMLFFMFAEEKWTRNLSLRYKTHTHTRFSPLKRNKTNKKTNKNPIHICDHGLLAYTDTAEHTEAHIQAYECRMVEWTVNNEHVFWIGSLFCCMCVTEYMTRPAIAAVIIIQQIIRNEILSDRSLIFSQRLHVYMCIHVACTAYAHTELMYMCVVA